MGTSWGTNAWMVLCISLLFYFPFDYTSLFSYLLERQKPDSMRVHQGSLITNLHLCVWPEATSATHIFFFDISKEVFAKLSLLDVAVCRTSSVMTSRAGSDITAPSPAPWLLASRLIVFIHVSLSCRLQKHWPRFCSGSSVNKQQIAANRHRSMLKCSPKR